MPDHQHFLIFLGAATLLAIAPGPGMLYVLARTVSGGRRDGVLSSLGTFTGGMVHVVAAATGLSLVLATSAVAFAAVKYAGAAYLVYLGLRMIIGARREDLKPVTDSGPRRNPFWQGMTTEILNPKTALFFLAFIPQFVSRSAGSVLWPFFLLGTISVALNTTSDLVVTWMVGVISARLRASAALRRRQQTVTGAVMIGLGVYVALADSQ